MSRDTLLSSLEAIRNQTFNLSRVVFMFHAWAPLNNLGPDGLRIKAVRDAFIPRLTLIPVVSIRTPIRDSRLDGRRNKYVPRIVDYDMPISHTVNTMLQRYQPYGMRQINSLDTTLDSAGRYLDIVAMIFDGGKDVPLESLPEYFGAASPQEMQFEAGKKSLKQTASQVLDELFKSGIITELEYHTFLPALSEFATSCSIAHNRALNPSDGILPASINAINDGIKRRYDEQDLFLIAQFPHYNADSRLSKATGNKEAEKTAQIIADAIMKTGEQRQAASETIDRAKLEAEIRAQVLSELKLDATPEDPAAPSFAGDAPEIKEGVAFTFEEAPVTEEVRVVQRCLGVTKAGTQCKRDANEGSSFCTQHDESSS